MCHDWLALLQSEVFADALLDLDMRYAEESMIAGCPRCGGRLHRANYERKPRGEPAAAGDGFRVRFSFCCAEDGCRCRMTPGSVRFLGRRIYVGLAVVLAAAAMHGETPARVATVARLLGCSGRTLRRWMNWWVTRFAESRLFRGLRGLVREAIDAASLPASLLAAVQAGSPSDTARSVLLLLRPLTGAVLPTEQAA